MCVPTVKSYSFRSCVRACEAAWARGTVLLPTLGFSGRDVLLWFSGRVPCLPFPGSSAGSLGSGRKLDGEASRGAAGIPGPQNCDRSWPARAGLRQNACRAPLFPPVPLVAAVLLAAQAKRLRCAGRC